LLLEEYERFRSELAENVGNARKLTPEEVAGAVAHLDQAKPGWDRDIRLDGVDHLLELLGDRIYEVG
jgi:hypothetical protein